MSTPQDPNFTPGSPEWWTFKLEYALINRRQKLLQFDRYYDGDHPLPFLSPAHQAKVANAFTRLLTMSKANFCGLVVDTTVQRLRPIGFRLSASGSEASDDETWGIYQGNNLDEHIITGFQEASVKGVSYLGVWFPQPGSKYPQITIEDPLQTIVAYDHSVGGFMRRTAALKMYVDEFTGDERAVLYLPDRICKFYRPAAAPTSLITGTLAGQRPVYLPWLSLGTPDSVIPNELGVVPIIPMRNNGKLLKEGVSDLENVVPIQDRINTNLFLRMLSGYVGAGGQKYIIGSTMMKDEETGEDIEFDAAVDRIFNIENPEAKVGQFDAADLTQFIESINQDVNMLAILSKVPKSMLLPTGQSPSGDAVDAEAAGLVAKCDRQKVPYGEAIEEALRLSRICAGMPATPPDSELIWADSESQSSAAVSASVIQQYQVGLLPLDAALEKLGYSPQAIARFKQQRLHDAMLAALTAPGLTPDGPPQQTPAGAPGAAGGSTDPSNVPGKLPKSPAGTEPSQGITSGTANG